MRIPGLPDGGVLSNVAWAGGVSATAWPVRPAARQNGSGYTAWTFMTVPIGMRCVSWSRRAGSWGL